MWKEGEKKKGEPKIIIWGIHHSDCGMWTTVGTGMPTAKIDGLNFGEHIIILKSGYKDLCQHHIAIQPFPPD